MVPVDMEMAPNEAPRLGKLPEFVSCQNCGAKGQTEVKKELSQWFGWLAVAIYWFTGSLTVCFCWIPCVMDAFQDYTHLCPNCSTIIGKSTPDDRKEEKKKGIKTVVITVLVTWFVGMILAIFMIILSKIMTGKGLLDTLPTLL